MQEVEKTIEIYQTAFTVCLVLGIVFLLITIFLFFKFNIRKIIDMKTGRGAKRTIQKMEEINARTGKLRQDMVPHTPLSLKPEERITYPVTSANPTTPGPAQNAGQPGTAGSSGYGFAGCGQSGNTMEMDGSGATEMLVDAGSQETTVLYQTSETTVLSENMTREIQQRKPELPGAFKIEKEVIWVHTKEVL